MEIAIRKRVKELASEKHVEKIDTRAETSLPQGRTELAEIC